MRLQPRQLRWQVRRDEPEKPSLPRQPDPSLERWLLPLIHFLRRDLPRATLHDDSIASAAVLATVPAATASLAGAFFTTWLTTWPVIGGSALRVTTSLLSSKHGLPERNSKFSSAARGWQHVAP